VIETRFILTGGAGNQLFVIYAGLYFKLLRSSDVSFAYRPSGNYSKSSSILEKLEFFPNLQVSSFTQNSPIILERAFQFLRKKSKVYNKLSNHFSSNYVSSELGLDFNLLNIRNGKNVYGYFQTSCYFDELNKIGISNPLLKSTSAWYNINLKKIKAELPIVMHVRRGDYLKHSGIYQFLDVNYYASAIENLPKELVKNPIWIFSDDQESARDLTKHLPSKKYYVVDQVNQEALEVLFLMSAGISHIIANSTFSWWSAKLSPQSIHITAPKVWFKDRDTPANLLPNHWNTI